MEAPKNPREFKEFVGGVVALDEARRTESDGGFESVMDRIAGTGTGFGPPSILGGGLLLLGGAALVLLPAPEAIQGSNYWRVARSAGSEVLALGDATALPMLLAGALLLVAGVVLGYRTAGAAEIAGVLGSAGLGFSALLWVAVGVLWLVNLVVLLTIIVAYIVGTIVLLAIFFGMLTGLANS